MSANIAACCPWLGVKRRRRWGCSVGQCRVEHSARWARGQPAAHYRTIVRQRHSCFLIILCLRLPLRERAINALLPKPQLICRRVRIPYCHFFGVSKKISSRCHIQLSRHSRHSAKAQYLELASACCLLKWLLVRHTSEVWGVSACAQRWSCSGGGCRSAEINRNGFLPPTIPSSTRYTAAFGPRAAYFSILYIHSSHFLV